MGRKSRTARKSTGTRRGRAERRSRGTRRGSRAERRSRGTRRGTRARSSSRAERRSRGRDHDESPRKARKEKKSRRSGKKKLNAYMLALQKARKSGADEFVYKGKTYEKTETKTGMVIYKAA
jgi:hypothetical protein